LDKSGAVTVKKSANSIIEGCCTDLVTFHSTGLSNGVDKTGLTCFLGLTTNGMEAQIAVEPRNEAAPIPLAANEVSEQLSKLFNPKGGFAYNESMSPKGKIPSRDLPNCWLGHSSRMQRKNVDHVDR
jgi:hypothetical protein